MKLSYDKPYIVYISTNADRSVLYTGVTNDLHARLVEHYLNKGTSKSFAGKYFCHHLIYYETFENINDAIAREKEIKKWRREKKINLINIWNPTWTFLNKEICGIWPPKSFTKK